MRLHATASIFIAIVFDEPFTAAFWAINLPRIIIKLRIIVHFPSCAYQPRPWCCRGTSLSAPARIDFVVVLQIQSCVRPPP